MTENRELTGLLKKVRTGDGEAMRELVEKYGPEVKAAIRHALNGNRLGRLIEPSDILQTVLLRLFLCGDGAPSSVQDGRAFLAAMANHRIVDYARKQRALKRDAEREVGDAGAAGVADPSPSPSRVLMFKEELEAFLRALPPSARAIAEERMAGATWEQIAGSRGEPQGTIEKRFHRALARLVNPLRKDTNT